MASIQNAFPNVSPSKLGDDLGYPAMLTYLPVGLLGVVVASLIAAYMSTISTQINLGASYLVNDVYKRFVDSKADEKKLVIVSRTVVCILAVLGALMG